MENIRLSFNEIKDALINDGSKVTMMLEGEPGIGKTALGSAVSDAMGYHFGYLDCANLSLGDLIYPVPNHDTNCIKFYPNDALNIHHGGPVVLILDEWTKASREVKNMTLPLIYERRLGSIKLHPDSIVFATGNMTRDGVGDSIQAHQRNRFVPVTMNKPTAEEWINNFAVNNNLDPTVIAFADQFPQAFDTYLDDPDDTKANGYIFNPKKAQLGYVSPRSLKFASDCIRTRQSKTENTLAAQLVGALGAPGAADLLNFVRMNEELPPFASIVADPDGTQVPSKPTNRLLLMFSLLVRAEKDNIEPILKYMDKFNNEMQGLFLNRLLSVGNKKAWAIHVKGVSQRAMKLHHVF